MRRGASRRSSSIPRAAGEVLVKLAASGLCHSDEHLVTGDLPFELPIIGGHEGAGVVEEVGEGVSWLAPGDHVVFGFIPSCGRCPSCSTGHQNLCDLGAADGRRQADRRRHVAHHAQGKDLGLMCLLGTFSHHTVVNEASCIKIENDVPLEQACLLGCGVVTGWGSAVYAAEVAPGDIVASSASVASAPTRSRAPGWPVPSRSGRSTRSSSSARRRWSSAPRTPPRRWPRRWAADQRSSWGTMANKVIMTMGVGSGEVLVEALALAAKRGRVVVTNIHPAMEMSANVSLLDLTLMEKQVVGSLFGSGNPRADIPKLLNLYREGQLDLDGLVTKTYTLDGVNDGYDAMRAGKNIRGVMVYD